MSNLTLRRKTRLINIGSVAIGSDHPVSIQSMCNTKTSDFEATVAQLDALHQAGAEIGRLSVVNMEDAEVLCKLVKASPLPLVADIHFDHRLALAAVDAESMSQLSGAFGKDSNVMFICGSYVICTVIINTKY